MEPLDCRLEALRKRSTRRTLRSCHPVVTSGRGCVGRSATLPLSHRMGGIMKFGFVASLAALCLACAAEAQVAVPAADQQRVVDYWIGDFAVTGVAKKNGGFSLNGNNLNFNTGQSEPVNG